MKNIEIGVVRDSKISVIEDESPESAPESISDKNEGKDTNEDTKRFMRQFEDEFDVQMIDQEKAIWRRFGSNKEAYEFFSEHYWTDWWKIAVYLFKNTKEPLNSHYIQRCNYWEWDNFVKYFCKNIDIDHKGVDYRVERRVNVYQFIDEDFFDYDSYTSAALPYMDYIYKDKQFVIELPVSFLTFNYD